MFGKENIYKIHKILDPIFSILLKPRIIRIASLYIGFQSRLQNDRNLCNKVSPKKEVIGGPFKGLKYASLQSVGSSLFPKLLGSYEDELHPVLDVAIAKEYDTIIDVGCAEGYYAAGLALRLPKSKVYAYDNSLIAKELCTKMIKINNLQSQIILKDFCDAKTLANFNLGKKSLVFCDCEGYEIELFTKESVANLKNSDVIVELHDCFNDNISKTILPLFKETHNVTLIRSNPQKQVLDYDNLKSIKNITDEDLNERHGVIMYWAFIEAKIK